MNLSTLNLLSQEAFGAELINCCGSSAWVQKMVDFRPFSSVDDLIAKAQEAWADCSEGDGLEAFAYHAKFDSSGELAQKVANQFKGKQGEQAAAKNVEQSILKLLANGYETYEQKFGFPFMVCVSGKSVEEIIQMLEQRLPNIPEIEIGIAMAEQMQITIICLEKLLKA